jgi:hypothetical protein
MYAAAVLGVAPKMPARAWATNSHASVGANAISR